MNAAPRDKYWWEERPPSGRTEAALRKVFEMARCIPGSQEAEENRDWTEWLDRTERAWLGSGLPSCLSEVEDAISAPEVATPYPVLLTEYTVRPRRKKTCSLCKVQGHVKTTCALNPKNIDVEPK